MKQDLKEKLLQDIKKTGYPLELKITSIFDKCGWRTQSNSYYIDKDENKGREIDLIASKWEQLDDDDGNYLEMTFYFITEIKTAWAKPWVLFSVTENKTGFIRHSVNLEVNKGVQYRRIIESYFIENVLNVQSRLGKSYYEGFSGNGSRDDIFKALSGTVKALEHYKESSFASKDRSTDKIVDCYIPLIIIDGPLFEAYLDDKGEIQLEEVKYMQAAFNYLSPNYNIGSENGSSIVHIIRFEYLEEFLNKYGIDMKKWARKIGEIENINTLDVD
ncbi:hypothetical protein CON01_01675 [Bacillus thuringiensis]|uniref:Uncharacterized protein n=1 Tax=Bacillus thuringiensis TaxID=1428 RepID=A0A9X6U3R2_BACTU|nr:MULTISPECIES: hypothetical protein [Bacillus cereus group]MCD2332913.1 hypothetical protein [Bacillus cereus]PED15873.1 hypothetical protein CON01_01675 [Bacillus thuringiensis]